VIIEAFDIVGISASQFLVEILSNNHYSNDKIVVDLLTNSHCIIELLARHSHTMEEWASNIMSDVCVQEVGDLSRKKHYSHVTVSHTSVEQLEEF
ncbi:uncharacterized protein EDB91DRAFT_1018780, partial [Suillus paluster]|uniref:uncharacterized protein n=1 Tax=Suillus paluster TaxID=48578 RepID=UPI001B866474